MKASRLGKLLDTESELEVNRLGIQSFYLGDLKKKKKSLELGSGDAYTML